MFELAEKSILENPGLQVIIVERISRFDSFSNDPAQIKSKLSQWKFCLSQPLDGKRVPKEY